MKFTLFTQAVLAIPMLTGAVAAPTENGRSLSSEGFPYLTHTSS